jgi:DNA invertase Pin-like site-specific DNA recombinase
MTIATPFQSRRSNPEGGRFAKTERTRISERVRTGLSRAKAKGTRSRKPVGRPKVVFNRETVVNLRRQGKSWRHIARECRAGVTTVRRAYRSITENSSLPKSGE